MKKLLSAVAVAGGLALLSGVASAQWGGGPGGRGGMGPGMMGGQGWMAGGPPCAGVTGAASEITDEKAKELPLLRAKVEPEATA